MSKSIFILFALSILLNINSYAQEKSRYMGGEVELITAPNGAIVNSEVLKIASQIVYNEPTIDKVAEGVWCIGGYSLANCTVIETEEGLIIYDTGDTKEEAEHIREAIKQLVINLSRQYLQSFALCYGWWCFGR